MPEYICEYPCHSPSEKRWFNLSVKPLIENEYELFLLSHNNITKQVSYKNELNIFKIDQVTEIFSRRVFSDFLNEEWKRCMRHKLPISVALLDIDNFKKINDEYGHLVGDLVLKEIALIIKENVKRPSDLCARYGGDEIVIVFGGTDLKGSLEIMKTIHSLAKEVSIKYEDKIYEGLIKTSIGLVTMYPQIGESEFKILKAADRLLYSAKDNAKNNIQFMEMNANVVDIDDKKANI